MPLMIKLNRNIVRVDLCLDNGHFITVFIFELEVIHLKSMMVESQYSLINKSNK